MKITVKKSNHRFEQLPDGIDQKKPVPRPEKSGSVDFNREPPLVFKGIAEKLAKFAEIKAGRPSRFQINGFDLTDESLKPKVTCTFDLSYHPDEGFTVAQNRSGEKTSTVFVVNPQGEVTDFDDSADVMAVFDHIIIDASQNFKVARANPPDLARYAREQANLIVTQLLRCGIKSRPSKSGGQSH